MRIYEFIMEFIALKGKQDGASRAMESIKQILTIKNLAEARFFECYLGHFNFNVMVRLDGESFVTQDVHQVRQGKNDETNNASPIQRRIKLHHAAHATHTTHVTTTHCRCVILR